MKDEFTEDFLKARIRDFMQFRVRRMSFEEACAANLEGIRKGKDGEIIYYALCQSDWEERKNEWKKSLNLTVQDNLVEMTADRTTFPNYAYCYSSADENGLYCGISSFYACLGNYYTDASGEDYFVMVRDNVEEAEHILFEAKRGSCGEITACSLLQRHTVWCDEGRRRFFERRILPVNLPSAEAEDPDELGYFNDTIEGLRNRVRFLASSRGIVGQPLYGSDKRLNPSGGLYGCDKENYNLINTVWRGNYSLHKTYAIALNGQKIQAMAKVSYNIPPLFHHDLLRQYAEYGWVDLPLNAVTVAYCQENLTEPPSYNFLHQPSQGCSVAQIERLKLLEQKLQRRRYKMAAQHAVDEELLQPGKTWTQQLS